jgi:hypothetical protein
MQKDRMDSVVQRASAWALVMHLGGNRVFRTNQELTDWADEFLLKDARFAFNESP